jgi:integrase
MPQFLMDEIKDYIKTLYGIGPNDRIFEVTKYNLHHEMNRGAKQANVKRIRIHDLRHPYVKPTTKKFITFFEVFRAAS